MNINTTAELRFVSSSQLEQLYAATTYKKIVIKQFFGLKKTTSYHDNFEPFLQENTILFDTLSGTGFLLFSDLCRFLEQEANLSLIEENNRRYPQQKFIAREEWALFIGYEQARTLARKLSDFVPDTEALATCNENAGMGRQEDVIPAQKAQIQQFVTALTALKPNQLLYVRSDNSEVA